MSERRPASVSVAPPRTVAYDIGIGICTAIDARQVSVKLDSAMVDKFIPGHPWRRSGTSLLYLDARLCSERKPPEVGEEIYLGRERIGARATGSLDVDGNGQLQRVSLRQLLDGLDPGPAPKAAKSRAKRR